MSIRSISNIARKLGESKTMQPINKFTTLLKLLTKVMDKPVSISASDMLNLSIQ